MQPECPAVLCPKCFASHVRVSLEERAYTGMLPKVRCPTCLVLLNQSQWFRYADPKDSHLLRTYEQLCDRACAFTPPCCHQEPYTHLPRAEGVVYDTDEGPPVLLSYLNTKFPAFRAQCEPFCRHRLTARELLASISSTFGSDKLSSAVKRALTRITDPERRATLLLAFLYVYPATFTRCCHFAICFNCKRTGHHDTCDDALRPIDEAHCMV